MSEPSVPDLIALEAVRQRDELCLIASENYVSQGVLDALGSVFTNKYAEGYPGKRYYGGQTYTDQLEQLTIDRAKTLFRADHANVQPLSGAPANVAVYFAWLEPGDTVLGMDLSHGGHLTHGAPVTYMSKLYRFVRYGMKDVATGEIDYDELEAVANKEQPKIILAGFSAYPRTIDYARIAAIAKDVGAVAMADMAHIAGFIAAGLFDNPLDHGFHVMTTTTHKTLRGPRGGLILSKGTVGNPLKAPEKTIENLPTLIDRAVFPGFQGGPHMNAVAGIAVALGEAQTDEYKTYAAQTLANAKRMAQQFLASGANLVTGGTDNHLMVIDCLKSWGIDGREAERIFDTIGVSTSKSTIPDDPSPPFKPSGLRLGTPAITTRGFKEAQVDTLVAFMLDAVKQRDDASALAAIKTQVAALARAFPPPTAD